MSGRKNNLRKFHNIVAGNMSADITSSVTNIEHLDNVAIQLHWTGTPTGDFKVQVSVDYEQDSLGNVKVAGNWVDVTLSPAPVAAGIAGDIFIDLNQLAAPWIRVFYDRTGGTGTLDSFISAKMI